MKRQQQKEGKAQTYLLTTLRTPTMKAQVRSSNEKQEQEQQQKNQKHT